MRRRLVLLLFVLLSATTLCAGQRPLTLCIVQSKPDQAMRYDPTAGPWAIGTYNQLSVRKLRDGSRLKITVLPASVQKDILPEIRRLQCARVVQLWYNHNGYIDPGQANMASGPQHDRPAFNSRPGDDPMPTSYEDSLFYSLWDAATQKVLGRGSVPLFWRSGTGESLNVGACATVAQQTLKWLNRTR